MYLALSNASVTRFPWFSTSETQLLSPKFIFDIVIYLLLQMVVVYSFVVVSLIHPFESFPSKIQ